jgi:hypothetical protein
MNKPPEKMLTVDEINGTFAEKVVQVQLPLPASYMVRSGVRSTNSFTGSTT